MDRNLSGFFFPLCVLCGFAGEVFPPRRKERKGKPIYSMDAIEERQKAIGRPPKSHRRHPKSHREKSLF
ncbi:MAG: hypothetical protein IPL32_10230 [Chloracidobacterium sp.]|nr:hypothetical protein [Chloracidobacterium sp.]